MSSGSSSSRCSRARCCSAIRETVVAERESVNLPDPVGHEAKAASAPGERFLVRTVGGPFPATRVADSSVMPWPLPDELPDPELRGVYRKVSESQLPPQPPESHVMRGAEYRWEAVDA